MNGFLALKNVRGTPQPFTPPHAESCKRKREREREREMRKGNEGGDE